MPTCGPCRLALDPLADLTLTRSHVTHELFGMHGRTFQGRSLANTRTQIGMPQLIEERLSGPPMGVQDAVKACFEVRPGDVHVPPPVGQSNDLFADHLEGRAPLRLGTHACAAR